MNHKHIIKTIKENINKNTDKIQTDLFYHYAEHYRHHITSEKDIEQQDFTEKFWVGIHTKIICQELINININGEVATGKSTAGFAIANIIKKAHYNKELTIHDIDRDQQEFSRTMINPAIKNTIRVVDEYNVLENTGENSTIEQQLLSYFNEVMAQRYIHRITHSPKHVHDPNCLIYLEILAPDKLNQQTYFKVYYKHHVNGISYRQLLGTLKVNVKHILKQKWYQQYRQRKFDKMNLLLEEGILQPRKLEYAKYIEAVVQKLIPLTKIKGILNTDLIQNYVRQESRKSKIPLSLIGEQTTISEVSGILKCYQSYFKLIQDIEHTQKQIDKGASNGKLIALTTQKQELEITKNTIAESIKYQMEELRNYQKINEKYTLKKELKV